MATQADLKKRLKALMNKPENQVCSDCPERQPRWASLIVAPPGSPPGALPMGAFCCLECSGSHRRLGVHISFVRSVNLDQWKEREVVAMETGGNKKVNAVFEARLDNGAKPSNQASGSVRERFIRDKYERRKYFDPDALQNVYVNSSSSEDESEDEQEEVAPSRVVRAPSDAAKKRAEIRQGRLASTPRTAADKSSTNSSRVPAKQKKPHVVAHSPVAPPEVDLLQFSSSPTVVSANHHLTPAPSSAPIPTLDLFKDMNLSDTNFNDMGYSNNNTLTATHQTATKTSFQKKKMTADEILAMFNNSSPPTGNDPPRFFDGFGTTNNNTTVTSSGVMSGPSSSSLGNGMQNFMSVQQRGSTMTMMQQNFTMMQQGGTMSQKSAVGNTTMTMTLNNAATNQMANNIAMQQPLGNDGFGLFGGTTSNGNIMTPQQQQVVPMGGYPNNFNAMGVNNNNNGGWAFNSQHGGQQQQQQSMFLMNNGLGRMNNNDGIMGSNSTTTGGPWSVVGNNNNNNTNNPQEDHFFASFGGGNGFGTS